MIAEQILEKYFRMWLEEDLPFLDVSNSFVPNMTGKAIIIAKEPIIVAGIPIITKWFDFLGLEAVPLVDEGQEAAPRQPLLEVVGPLRKILRGERIGLNIFSRMCAISTLTRSLVTMARTKVPSIRIAATRKTTPGLRLFEKYAVRVGGGDTHRFSLSDCIMIKDNHVSIFGSITNAIKAARQHASFTTKIEVEADTPEQAIEAARAKADIILLDNFKPEEIQSTIPKIREHHPRVIIELSGGITPENLEKYLISGVDVISLGFLTHSVKNVDLSLEVTSVNEINMKGV